MIIAVRAIGCYDLDEPRHHPLSHLITTYLLHQGTTFAVYYLLTNRTNMPRLHYHLGRGWVFTLVPGTMDTEIRRREPRSVGYGIRDGWITERGIEEEQDTHDIYAVIEDTQDRQTQIYQSVGTLVDDSQYHYETARLLDQEALVSREAWGRSIEVSYMTRSEILSLRSVVMGQQAVISQLQTAAVKKSQVVTFEMYRQTTRGSYATQPVKYYGLFPASRLYRSFYFVSLSSIGLSFRKWAPKRNTTKAMINEGVTAALAARDATRNGDDSHTSGTGARRPVQVAHECTYPDFLKCQPLNFKGTEGVVGLTQWFEKMESVYSISNCTLACQVKFATCTLQRNALTWWNSHVKTTTPEAAHAIQEDTE
ncbi:hypothetical protein Tco_0059303 [Tanacetum coccineum]